MLLDEDDQAFIRRRLEEERRRVGETSCIVRSVHEEAVELYEERSRRAAEEAAGLEALLARIDRA